MSLYRETDELDSGVMIPWRSRASSLCSVVRSTSVSDPPSPLPPRSPLLPQIRSIPASPVPSSRRGRYWYEDGTVVVKVDNTLYKLYKGVLVQHSAFFKRRIGAVPKSFRSWILASPPISSTTRKTAPTRVDPDPPTPTLTGFGSENDPIVLDVADSEFELLLSVFLPDIQDIRDDFTGKKWAAVAIVAEKLEFVSLQAVAVDKAYKLCSPLELIDIGRSRIRYKYYLEGCRQLCVRDAPLTRKEGRHLGVDCAVMIGHIREDLAKGATWSDAEALVHFTAKTEEEERLMMECS